jgi:hypothetical protein
MDDLLIKYIMEETSPEESDNVRQWLAADAVNRTHFKKLQNVWQLASQTGLPLTADTPQALQRLKQTLKAREAVPMKRIWQRVAVAASVVGIVAMAYGAYVLIKPKHPVKEQAPVVQPDTVQQKPVLSDTVPNVQPVPVLPADTFPLKKQYKKKRPAQPKAQPAIPAKKKQAVPVQRTQPVKKHKTAPLPRSTPQDM